MRPDVLGTCSCSANTNFRAFRASVGRRFVVEEGEDVGPGGGPRARTQTRHVFSQVAARRTGRLRQEIKTGRPADAAVALASALRGCQYASLARPRPRTPSANAEKRPCGVRRHARSTNTPASLLLAAPARLTTVRRTTWRSCDYSMRSPDPATHAARRTP